MVLLFKLATYQTQEVKEVSQFMAGRLLMKIFREHIHALAFYQWQTVVVTPTRLNSLSLLRHALIWMENT